jgi:hypothetical protein
MKRKLVAKLYFIIVLPLIILGTGLFVIARSPDWAAGSEFEPVVAQDKAAVNEGEDSDAHGSNNQPRLITTQQITQPIYGSATILLEDLGGSTTILLSPYANITNTLENALGSFNILKEGDTYYLWLGSRVRTGTLSNVTSIEQRFESQDGLVWHDRTNTNLAWNGSPYKLVWGLRQVIKNGGLYEGWEEYYYEWSAGWGMAVRYITSTNGLTWTVNNQPALIGAWSTSVAKTGSTYHMWENPHADRDYYSGSWSLLHRTSINGGTGWGNWQTGGTTVKVDGTKEVMSPNRIRQSVDGTYQLFYIEGSSINLATSTDGINFATQVTNLLDVLEVLPISRIDSSVDFIVVDVGGEDWFYFTYCVERSASSGFCDESRIAVSRPIRPNVHYVYLPVIIFQLPSVDFPVFIGNAIPVRPVNHRGEIFYTRSVEIPAQIPPSGHFYFSSQPDTVANVLVDDELAVLLNGEEVFIYDFSTSGSPKPTVLEVPRQIIEQWAGQTVVVEYRDVYGSVVEASEIWLIWVP